jgi:hypothetical protein
LPMQASAKFFSLCLQSTSGVQISFTDNLIKIK